MARPDHGAAHLRDVPATGHGAASGAAGHDGHQGGARVDQSRGALLKGQAVLFAPGGPPGASRAGGDVDHPRWLVAVLSGAGALYDDVPALLEQTEPAGRLRRARAPQRPSGRLQEPAHAPGLAAAPAQGADPGGADIEEFAWRFQGRSLFWSGLKLKIKLTLCPR